jgi:hypothetical protein
MGVILAQTPPHNFARHGSRLESQGNRRWNRALN